MRNGSKHILHSIRNKVVLTAYKLQVPATHLNSNQLSTKPHVSLMLQQVIKLLKVRDHSRE